MKKLFLIALALLGSVATFNTQSQQTPAERRQAQLAEVQKRKALHMPKTLDLTVVTSKDIPVKTITLQHIPVDYPLIGLKRLIIAVFQQKNQGGLLSRFLNQSKKLEIPEDQLTLEWLSPTYGAYNLDLTSPELKINDFIQDSSATLNANW